MSNRHLCLTTLQFDEVHVEDTTTLMLSQRCAQSQIGDGCLSCHYICWSINVRKIITEEVTRCAYSVPNRDLPITSRNVYHLAWCTLYDRCLQFAQRIRRIGNDTLHLPAVAMLPTYITTNQYRTPMSYLGLTPSHCNIRNKRNEKKRKKQKQTELPLNLE